MFMDSVKPFAENILSSDFRHLAATNSALRVVDICRTLSALFLVLQGRIVTDDIPPARLTRTIGGESMRLYFLDRDPYFSALLEHRLNLAFPNLDLHLIRDFKELDDLSGSDLLVYTAEQFPALKLLSDRTLRLHSRRPDLSLLSAEITDQEDNPESHLIFRDDPLDTVWTVIETFVMRYYTESEAGGGFTAVSLPADGSLSEQVGKLVHDRLLSCDQLLLVPVMPAYFWPYLADRIPEQQTLSDLLLDLSLRKAAKDVELSPYLCLSTFGCQTLVPPRHSDDLILAGPGLYKQLLQLISDYIESAGPERWEVLLIHYAAPLQLVRVGFSLCRRYYLADDSAADPVLLRFSEDIESLYSQTPADCTPLKLPWRRTVPSAAKPLRDEYYA